MEDKYQKFCICDCLCEDRLLWDVVEGCPRPRPQLPVPAKLQRGLQHNSGVNILNKSLNLNSNHLCLAKSRHNPHTKILPDYDDSSPKVPSFQMYESGMLVS